MLLLLFVVDDINDVVGGGVTLPAADTADVESTRCGMRSDKDGAILVVVEGLSESIELFAEIVLLLLLLLRHGNLFGRAFFFSVSMISNSFITRSIELVR